MKAMILAAGLGTRLRPLTERWPKPAIPLLGQPLLRYSLSVLKRAGIQAVGFNTHHLPEVMTQVAQEEAERMGLGATFVHEPVIQGTGGGIRGLKSFLKPEESFVVFNGDILFGLELLPLIDQHRASRALATMLLLPMPPGESYGAVDVDPEGRVRRIAGHGPGGQGLTPWHFTGVHILSPAVFDFMSASGPEDINRDVYVRIMTAGLPVRGAVVKGYWSDLGTPRRYLATQGDLLRGRVDLSFFPEASPFPTSTPTSSLVAASAQVDPSARISDSYVGGGIEVPRAARVHRSAVLEGTVLRPAEQLSDVIAWSEHRISGA